MKSYYSILKTKTIYDLATVIQSMPSNPLLVPYRLIRSIKLSEEEISPQGTEVDCLQIAEAESPAFSIGLVVVTLSLISGLATYFILTGLTPIVPHSSVVLTVLLTNVCMIIAMIVVISWPIG